MFAEDYIFIMPDSSVVTKAQVVQELRSREITWDSAVGEDMRVRVYGDTAVVTGRFLGRGRLKEKDLNEHQRFIPSGSSGMAGGRRSLSTQRTCRANKLRGVGQTEGVPRPVGW
jgi:Domain of unknown function (DUF4440)